MESYLQLACKNEDLKSEERVLDTAISNLRKIETLLIEKEKQFCTQDHEYRFDYSVGGRDMLRKRCDALIDHLVHYKCIIECLAGDLLALSNKIIDDDEYVRLSLIFREAELSILNAINVNQQRNVIFTNMYDEEAMARIIGVEEKWRKEHEERRKSINRLLLDQNQIIIEKITKNLEEQQKLLDQRYNSMNNLIRKVLIYSTTDQPYHK